MNTAATVVMEPVWKSVTDELRAKIEDGEYRSGDRFYTISELSKKFDIGDSTSRRVLRELSESGHVKSLRGSGTYLWKNAMYGRCKNVYESLMVLRREFGSAFMKGMGLSWFNLYKDGNVFANHAIVGDIKKMQCMANAAYACKSDLSSDAEIAVVFDELRAFRCPARGTVPYFSNYFKIGAPIDFYTLNRLDLLPRDKYKLVIFVSCGYMDEQEKQYIEKLKGNGRTLLFMYANGIVKNNKFDLKAAHGKRSVSKSRKPGG